MNMKTEEQEKDPLSVLAYGSLGAKANLPLQTLHSLSL